MKDLVLLEARRTTYGWCVIDPQGGVWWPNHEAAREIDESADPDEAAITICQNTPMRGTWRQ